MHITKISSLSTIVALGLGLFCSREAAAASLASDNASDPAYNDGWDTGDNGGTGFEPWEIVLIPEPSATNPIATATIASSTANGDGDSNGDGDIDTSGEAWRMSVDSEGSSVDINRVFIGNLSVGQTFLASFDNGFLATGQGGISLLQLNNFLGSAGGGGFWNFFADEGAGRYFSNAGSSFVDVGPLTDEGLDLAFTLTSATTFQLTITFRSGGTPVVINQSLSGSNPMLNRLVLRHDLGGAGAGDFFINRIAIVPEPSSIGLLLLGVGALFYRALGFSRSRSRKA